MIFASVDREFHEEAPTSLQSYHQKEFVVSDDRNIESFFKESRSKIPLPIVQDAENRYLATKWLQIFSYKSDSHYIARSDHLNLFGSGQSERQAIEDLSHQIIYLFNFYQNLDESDATKDAIEAKKIYRDLLIKVG